MNIIADITSAIILNAGYTSTGVYSILFPTEIILWLAYYNYHSKSKNEKKAYLLSSFFVLLFSSINYLFIQKNIEFNSYTLIPLSLFMFIISYMKLRNAIQEDSFYFNSLLTWALIANILYYGIVIESITAMMVSYKSNIGDARNFLKVNYAGYAVWSMLLCIGCIIKKK